jgi:hypothetical protein
LSAFLNLISILFKSSSVFVSFSSVFFNFYSEFLRFDSEFLNFYSIFLFLVYEKHARSTDYLYFSTFAFNFS